MMPSQAAPVKKGRGAPIATQTGVSKVTSLSTPTSKRVLTVTQSPLPNDPVTKALIDNALGNVSSTTNTKAPQVKAKELLLEIRKAGDSIKLDERNSIFRCLICNMAFNSIQQLQAHLSGTKHASVKAGDSLPAGSKPATTSGQTTSTTTTAQKNASSTTGPLAGEGTAKKMKMDSNGTAEGKPLPKEEAIITLPSGVVKVDNAQGKSNRYRCTVCQITVNSDTQLHQHLAAQKHQDKVAGKQHAWWKAGAYKGGAASTAAGAQAQKRDYSSYYAGGNDEYYNSTYPSASYGSSSYGSAGSYGSANAYAAGSYGSAGSYGYNSYSDYTDYSYAQDDRSPYSTGTSAMYPGSSAAATSAARMGGGSGYARPASFGGMGRAAGLRPNPPRVPRPEQTFVSGGMMK